MVNLDGVTLQRSKFSFPRGRRNKGVEAAQGVEMDTYFTFLVSEINTFKMKLWGGSGGGKWGIPKGPPCLRLGRR